MEKIKVALLILIILLVFLSTGGCSKLNMRENDNTGPQSTQGPVDTATYQGLTIPCLIYREQNNQTVAVKASWDIGAGALDISQDEVFFFSNTEPARFPEIWDGANNIVLVDSYVPSAQYNAHSKLVPKSDSAQAIFWGENIQLTKIPKTDGELDKYRIEVSHDGQAISKDIRPDMQYQDQSGQSYDLNPNDLSFTYFDGENAFFVYTRSMDNGIGLLSLKYNILTDEKSLTEIPTHDLCPETLLLQNTIENIKTRFYTPTYNGIGVFDIGRNKFEYMENLSNDCNNYIKSTAKSEFHQYMNILGVYNDILIVSVPVHTGKTDESLYCAIKDNKIIAAIYRQDQIMKFMDANKKIKSEINLQKLKLKPDMPLAFPGKNGLNW